MNQAPIKSQPLTEEEWNDFNLREAAALDAYDAMCTPATEEYEEA